jgi:hypothetical protein
VGGVGAEIPTDVLRATPAKKAVDLQKVARRVRKRMNTGQAAGPVSKATVSTPRDILRRQVPEGRGGVVAGRGRALHCVPRIRSGSAGAGRGGRASHGTDQEKTVRACKRRRRKTCSGTDGESDTDGKCNGDSAWSPGQVFPKESGSAPIRATRARAAALEAAAGAAAARQSPDGPACHAASSDSAVASSDSASASAEPAVAAAAAAAAAVGDDYTPANPALLADVQMTSFAAGSLSDDDISIVEAAARARKRAAGGDDGDPQLKGLAAGKEILGAKRHRPAGSDGSEDESDESDYESGDDIPQILTGSGRVWSYAFVIALHNFYYDDSKEDNSAWHLGNFRQGDH